MNTMPFAAGSRKIRILSQESVSRMDGVNTLGLRQFNDFIYSQISVNRRLALAYLIGPVGLCPEQRFLVFLRIDRDAPDVQFFAGSEYPDGDLAAVCDQYTLEFFLFCHNVIPLSKNYVYQKIYIVILPHIDLFYYTKVDEFCLRQFPLPADHRVP